MGGSSLFSERRQAARQPGAPGAVVLGGDHQGLGIVRSLGRVGVRVCVLDDERSIARWSRYTTYHIHVDDLVSPAGTIAALLDVARHLPVEGWVLYPTRDEQVETIAQHRDELVRIFRVPTPSWSVVQWACDKRNTYRLAEQLGIPAPRTWSPREVTELEAVDHEGPWAIKPASRGPFLYRTKAKAWRADSRAELTERFRAAAALTEGEVMVQELIPGDGRQQYAYCALFKKRRALAVMTARRRRQHPPQFGRATTLAETVDLPLLEDLSERFLRHVGYYGLVELEYKLDPRDGAYKLLDVNTRTWGYHTLGYAAGVDFPLLLFSDQLDNEPPPVRARPGVRWVRLVTDVPTVAVQMRAGDLRLRDYVRSLRGLGAESVLSRQDPLPALAELLLVPYLIAKRGF